MSAAITFDFHNTLVRCDPWFDLEVRTLPVKVLDALEGQSLLRSGQVDRMELETAYRTLRTEIIGHGVEMDAIEGTRESFRRVGLPINGIAIAEIVDSLFRELVVETSLVAGAADTVTYLVDHGVSVAIVSSAVHHEFLEWSLQLHELRGHFATINTSASTGFYKSRPEIYTATLEELGSSPEQTIHVGDSYRFDHIGGRAAGLQTVWLNESGASRPQDPSPPMMELSSLIGAGPVLLRLSENLASPSNAD